MKIRRMAWGSAVGILMGTAAGGGTIQLQSGDVIKGLIRQQTEQDVTIEHPIYGTLVTPRAMIEQMQLEEGDAMTVTSEGEGAALEAAAAPGPMTEEFEPESKPELERFFAGWESRIEVGFEQNTGNTESFDGRVRFETNKETERDRWKADAAYYLSSEDNEETKNEFTAGLFKDWLIPESRWFYWAKGRYDLDEFQSWDHRVSASGGVGYDWIKTDDLTVTFRGGLGGAKEFGSEDDDIRPEGVVGAEVAWQLNDTQKIVGDTFIYPDLGDLGEFRATSSLAWEIALDYARGLAFKLGLENEYESEVDPGIKHNDLKIFGALVFDF
jgi:putative salt-induced outer membrane protein